MNDSSFLDPARAGIFCLAPERAEAAKIAAHQAKQPVIQARIGASEKDSVLQELGMSLSLPDWYGANFDALYDCLTDPDLMPASVVLLSGLEHFCKHDPDGFANLIDVLTAAADYRRDSGQPLWFLLDIAAPGIREWPSP